MSQMDKAMKTAMNQAAKGLTRGARTVLACLVLLLTTPVISSAQVIVKDGEPKAVIVTAEDAPDSVHLAATELQGHIEDVTGALLPIRHDPLAAPVVNVFLGGSPVSGFLGFSTDGFGPDEYRIVNGHGFLAIFGSDYRGAPIHGYRNPWAYNEVYNEGLKTGAFGETGTLYGVYRFLETCCGVRWYMPGELGTVIPKKSTIEVPPMDLRCCPDFEYRYPWFCNFAVSDDDALWYRRAGFGAPCPAQIIHSFNLFVGKYRDTHPEYFAIIDG